MADNEPRPEEDLDTHEEEHQDEVGDDFSQWQTQQALADLNYDRDQTRRLVR
jgi:hypothetical protein